jgi:hypothetical protein
MPRSRHTASTTRASDIVYAAVSIGISLNVWSRPSAPGRLIDSRSDRNPTVPRNARNCGRQQIYNRKERPSVDIKLALMRVLCLESATHSESGANRTAMSDKRT